MVISMMLDEFHVVNVIHVIFLSIVNVDHANIVSFSGRTVTREKQHGDVTTSVCLEQEQGVGGIR